MRWDVFISIYMSDISLANYINVAIKTTPSGLANYNVNNVLLLTEEDGANFTQPFKAYTSYNLVATDFGASSKTAKMASVLFSQNYRAGGGYLIIAPYIVKDAVASVSAKSAIFKTPDVSANLSALYNITDGRIKINNVIYKNINFKAYGASSINDIATILGSTLTDYIVSVETDNKIVITSKQYGLTPTITIATDNVTAGTDLAGSAYFNTGAGALTAGSNAAGENVIDAYTRLINLATMPYFTAILTTKRFETAVITDTATAIEATNKMFIYGITNFTSDVTAVGQAITSAKCRQTRVWLHNLTELDALLYMAGQTGLLASTNFNSANVALTLHVKQLAGVNPDTNINDDKLQACKTAGVDCYPVASNYANIFTSGANDFTDNVYYLIALKSYLEVAGFNTLAQTTTKIPQTEAGMSIVKNNVINILQQFVNFGFIAPGAWNSPDTFGDPVLFKKGILQNGFFVYSQPISEQSQTDRNNRIAPVIQIAIKTAGAIQYIIINGSVEY